MAGGEPRFHVARVTRHQIAAEKIEDGGEGVAGGAGQRRRPFRIDARGLDGAQEIENTDDEDERGVLEQRDIAVDDIGNGDAQGLRQNDQPHHLPIAEPDRLRALILSARDRLQAGAHHLRHIGGCEQGDADQRAQQFVRRPGIRHEQRQHHARHEQNRNERHPAHELDEDHREQPHDRHVRTPPERERVYRYLIS